MIHIREQDIIFMQQFKKILEFRDTGPPRAR